MDYRAAVLRAARRRTRRAVDVDVQTSLEGTLWALHWARVGRNKLRDPLGHVSPHALIGDLPDAVIMTLEAADGTGRRPHRIDYITELAALHDVRLELELKTFVPAFTLRRLLESRDAAYLARHGLLVFKTRAGLAGAVARLRAVKRAGGITLLTFQGYLGRGLSRSAAWPVTDYVRGLARWTR